MKTAYIPVLIIGCSFMGTGLATTLRSKCLVVQRDIMAGAEFICSYRPGTEWNQQPEHERIKQFREELVRRGILGSEGRVTLPGLQPVLYEYIKKEQLPINFMTEVIEVKKVEHGYETIVSDVSGLHCIKSSYIIDTTQEGQCMESKQTAIEKSINALIHSVNGEDMPDLPLMNEQFELVQGNCRGEVIIRYFLDTIDSMIDARRELYHFWSSRPQQLSDWRIDAIASMCEQHMGFTHKKVDHNWDWYPIPYKNPLDGMDQGIRLGQQLQSKIIESGE